MCNTELSELAGYTARMALLFDTMKDVKKGKFEKALVSSADVAVNAKGLVDWGCIAIYIKLMRCSST